MPIERISGPVARLRQQTAGIAVCLTLVAGLAGSACARVVPVTDPQTAAIQRARDVVAALDLVVDATIAARDVGWISQDTMRAVLTSIQAALPVIQASPAGAKATALAALVSAKNLPGAAKVLPYLRWAEATIGAMP